MGTVKGDEQRILVVDDDTDVREVIATALAGCGFVVETAVDGQDALLRLPARFCLVVADVQMPRLGGLDLIRALRARGFALPVVLMTGAETRDLRTAAESYGARACLPKPVSMDDLVWTIDCALATDGVVPSRGRRPTLRGPAARLA
jgi:CheY-like chemotaxis protein